MKTIKNKKDMKVELKIKKVNFDDLYLYKLIGRPELYKGTRNPAFINRCMSTDRYRVFGGYRSYSTISESVLSSFRNRVVSELLFVKNDDSSIHSTHEINSFQAFEKELKSMTKEWLISNYELKEVG